MPIVRVTAASQAVLAGRRMMHMAGHLQSVSANTTRSVLSTEEIKMRPFFTGGWNYAQSYGPTFAPIFSGSPAGSAGTGANARGSGSIVVLAEGTAEIDGKLYADGEKSTGSMASGGGIWLAASDFTFGDNALLTAKGKDGSTWQTGPGGGGRIALAEGCTTAQIDTMFEGGWPKGVIEAPTIEGVAVNVSGGKRNDGSGLVDGSVSMVRPSDDPAAEANVFVGPHSGDWLTADNWSSGQVPQPTDRVVIREKTVFMPGSITVRSLTLETASLRLGNKTDHIAPVIAGDLTLNGVSKLYVSAGEISESDYETVFDTVEHTLAELRSKANIVTIRGNFTVNDTSVVYPEAAVLTGVPVVFAVSNDFTLAEGASFDATGLGWGWQDGKWSECQHQSVCKPGRNGWNIQDSDGWTLAIGAGMDYAYGGIYGGNRSFDSFQEKSYSGSYGPTFAPIFSGSPGGSAGTAANVRGSGSIVVLAQGSAVVDGILTADSVKKHNTCASGGGIWLAASAFTFGANAKLTAKGLDSPRNIYGGGGGGRIAIAEGCSQAQVYAMFNGAIPEGAVETLDITGVAVDVEGGINGNTSGISGSLSTVRAGSVLTTQSDVAELNAAGVVWGDEELLSGTYERTAPQYAYSLRDGTLRYTCKGFVVSNAVEQVAEGPGLTATVEIDSETGPFTLTWRWGDPTTVDPEPVSRCWVGPEEGGVFADYWNWDPAGTPTRVDELYVTNVTLSVSKVEVGKLVLSSANLMVVDADEFIVNGDMELGDNSIWTITALPTNGTATAYADGATHIAIGGNLTLADTATVKPISDPWTGGSVVFTVAGDFMLGASAKFDAVAAGWNWVEYTGDSSPCALATATASGKNYQTMALGYGHLYLVAGSYGGRGGFSGGWEYMVKDAYGFATAPFYPGSPNGVQGADTFVPGGGLIRIHVSGKAAVDGVLDASAGDAFYGGASGGGIWLTAGKFAFGATAKLLAKGGPSGYASQGAGGRIAIGTGLTSTQMASLLSTGKCARRVKDIELFNDDFPSVTVDVGIGEVKRVGWGPSGEPGTFSYYPQPKGLAIFLR